MSELVDLLTCDPVKACALIYEITGSLSAETLDAMSFAHGLAPQECVAASLSMSTHAWASLSGGQPVAMLGAAPSAVPGCGLVWMLDTAAYREAPPVPSEAYRQLIAELRETYQTLCAVAQNCNAMSIDLLKSLGFALLLDKIGPYGESEFFSLYFLPESGG
ncbi:hypothetical protein M2337_000516 [Sphingobium sp. B2D3A]|uniref:hypothetical protein n=1 Tax=unclassified Sphingobium TaxID=2611147 RepID=UPI00222514C3|nr:MULTISPECIES: hypothetical protein [unclassified Sphingobium]MCW2336283.1 hypothetical protein [Sphingobium sp. B2D3A]MCW2386038.1 hypothetical protein [Sphingobium sp. B2D3D]